MLAQGVLISWLVILNITALGLFFFAYLKLPASKYRSTFLAFLIPYSVWANCLFIIHIVGSESSASRVISQTIFASGAFYHVLLGYLLISLASPGKLRTMLFRSLGLNTLLVGVCSYAGLWERGVTFNIETGLAPIPGPSLWYFNVSLLIWALYYFSTIVIAYCGMRARDSLKCQLKVLVWPAIFSMTMSLTTNVVLPGLTKNYSLTAIGGFWLFVFFSAIAYIIKVGSNLVIYDAIRTFESRLALSSSHTYEELGELVKASIYRARTISRMHAQKVKHPIAPLLSS